MNIKLLTTVIGLSLTSSSSLVLASDDQDFDSELQRAKEDSRQEYEHLINTFLGQSSIEAEENVCYQSSREATSRKRRVSLEEHLKELEKEAIVYHKTEKNYIYFIKNCKSKQADNILQINKINKTISNECSTSISHSENSITIQDKKKLYEDFMSLQANIEIFNTALEKVTQSLCLQKVYIEETKKEIESLGEALYESTADLADGAITNIGGTEEEEGELF